MARFDPARTAGRMVRAVKTTDWTAKAKQGAATLKAEYEAGKQGEDTAVTPLWATPKEQLDGVVGLLHKAKSAPPPPADDLEADADEVAASFRGVDWDGVRAATAKRTSDASQAMRAMAEQVDWAKVQPVAAQVSSALIAAVASGQLRIGGHLGSTVMRTIVNQGGLAQRVATTMAEDKAPLPPDFRGAIDTTADEA